MARDLNTEIDVSMDSTISKASFIILIIMALASICLVDLYLYKIEFTTSYVRDNVTVEGASVDRKIIFHQFRGHVEDTITVNGTRLRESRYLHTIPTIFPSSFFNLLMAFIIQLMNLYVAHLSTDMGDKMEVIQLLYLFSFRACISALVLSNQLVLILMFLATPLHFQLYQSSYLPSCVNSDGSYIYQCSSIFGKSGDYKWGMGPGWFLYLVVGFGITIHIIYLLFRMLIAYFQCISKSDSYQMLSTVNQSNNTINNTNNNPNIATVSNNNPNPDSNPYDI